MKPEGSCPCLFCPLQFDLAPEAAPQLFLRLQSPPFATPRHPFLLSSLRPEPLRTEPTHPISRCSLRFSALNRPGFPSVRWQPVLSFLPWPPLRPSVRQSWGSSWAQPSAVRLSSSPLVPRFRFHLGPAAPTSVPLRLSAGVPGPSIQRPADVSGAIPSRASRCLAVPAFSPGNSLPVLPVASTRLP